MSIDRVCQIRLEKVEENQKIMLCRDFWSDKILSSARAFPTKPSSCIQLVVQQMFVLKWGWASRHTHFLHALHFRTHIHACFTTACHTQQNVIDYTFSPIKFCDLDFTIDCNPHSLKLHFLRNTLVHLFIALFQARQSWFACEELCILLSNLADSDEPGISVKSNDSWAHTWQEWSKQDPKLPHGKTTI